MKIFFIGFIFLAAGSLSQACPDIGGTYTSLKGKTAVNVQGMENGLTTLRLDVVPVTFILDGRSHMSQYLISYTAVCSGETIDVKLKGYGKRRRIVITKTLNGYRYESDEPRHPGDEYVRQ